MSRSSSPDCPQSQANSFKPMVPFAVIAALAAVGWALWQQPVEPQPTVAVSAAVASVETDQAVPPNAALPSETPVSAELPANDLTDERLAAYWDESVETIRLLHSQRALDNEHLAIIPEPKFRRAVWRISHPKSDQPDEAIKWRTMRQRDENGRVAPDGLINAIRERQAILRRQQRGSVAGLPVGPEDAAPGRGGANEKAGVTPSGWRWLGPGNIGGRTRALIQHPTSTNTYYAGSVGGGVWRTTNGGTTWAALTGFSANLACSTLAMDPTNSNVIYAGTGEGFFNGDAIRGAGIFRTSDGGTNWSQLSATNNSNFYYVNRIAISPDGNTILAATNNGLFRSTDGGASWSIPSGGVNVRMLDADFHPSNSNLCVCSGTGAAVFYSTNGGASWSAATGFTPSGRVEICYAVANPSIVYLSIENPGGAIYRSTDGGQTYSLRGSHSYLGSQGWYDNVIWAGDPSNADRVIVGGIDLYRSTDGGQSLSQISVWFLAPSSAHADHHVICTPVAYNGTSNQTLMFGNDGGIYRGDSVWGSNTWQELNNQYGVTQFYGGSGNPTSGVYYGGTQDNGTLRYTGNTEGWSTSFGGDGGYSASDPTDPNYHYGEYVRLQIHRSTNGGVSASYIYTGIADAGGAANFIAPFVLDPSNPNRLLAGGASLWRSDDVKNTTPSWTSIKSSVGSNISAICVNPKNSDQIWVGHNNGDLYYTTNGTSGAPTWTKMDGTILPNRTLTRIAVDPKNGAIVYVSFGGFTSGNLWRTANSGASWANISAGLPTAPVYGIAIHPTNTTWVYAGTEVGVFATEDSGTTWGATSDGPVNVSVDEITMVGTKLLAVTHGRGMYDITPSTSSGGGGPPPNENVVTYSWNAANRTLTLTGDSKNNANSVTATWRSDRIVLTASGETRILVGSTQTTSATIVTGTGQVSLTGDLKGGNDKLSLVSLPIKSLTMKFGAGADTCTLSYCAVTTSACDGGEETPGDNSDNNSVVDSFLWSTSTIGSKTGNKNFENTSPP
uniref:Photosynthesis system II assembly factor Ycf48/Hcf136-like domain-containing protein n=1 Tax=Schlesneria paludicola TaxID=360056 RepID=A0A7C2JYJ0_9PLAN